MENAEPWGMRKLLPAQGIQNGIASVLFLRKWDKMALCDILSLFGVTLCPVFLCQGNSGKEGRNDIMSS
ncbi:MAG TPA: hypothetical protein DD422_04760 [Akkermansia sp.]|nr:hypothetical protein [Akkermansia sp.]